MEWWREPLASLVAGHRVIVVGGPAVMWTEPVNLLRELGATAVLVVGTEGIGVGLPPQDADVVVVEREDHGDDVMAALHAGIRVVDDPPPHVVDAVEAFDPDRSAVVIGSFLTESPTLIGRPLVAHRRPAWVGLEDKTRLAGLLDRAGVVRSPCIVVPVDEAVSRWRELDEGAGTVWAADATNGFHGGGRGTRWVTDDDEAAAVAAELGTAAKTVRVMPFLDGIATSVHGIVLPDGVAVLRPVELVTLRQGHELRYSGCATFWDPPDTVRHEMRTAARAVGEALRDDVDYRGAFTLDGVATVDGFRPTELNPRFGAGLSVITRGLAGVPLSLVLDLVVAGRPLRIGAADLEREVLAVADASRSGGTWQLHAATPRVVDGAGACFDGAEWRWARPDEPVDAVVAAAEGFARAQFEPMRTPVGPSVGARSVAFWRFADRDLGTAIGPLTAPPDLGRSSF
jgi:hypothetical protein